MKKLVLLLLTICLTIPFLPPVAGHAAAPEPSPGMTYQFELLPQMELLAGALTQTAWDQKMGPRCGGSAYYRALKDLMTPYKSHPAVQILQEMQNRGFVFDAPPTFIGYLGELPGLELKNEYSAYLIKRAGGRENLEKLRLALADLAARSNFMAFFSSWRMELRNIVGITRASCDVNGVVDWMNNFYGRGCGAYRSIVSPGMYGGNYGPTLPGPDGQPVATEIICALDTYSEVPAFPSGQDLERLLLHEWGHSFVNPTLGAFPEQVSRLTPLFAPVEEVMRKQAYGAVEVFLNEQVLRAATALAVRERHGDDAFRQNVKNNVSWGFYLTPFVVEQLDYYATHRDQFPTFREFAPYLLDRLEEYQAKSKG